MEDYLPTYLRKDSFRIRIIIVLFAFLLYGILFILLYQNLEKGIAISAIAAVIPAVILGWLYGCLSGLFAGFLTLPLNMIVLQVLGTNFGEEGYNYGTAITGTVAIVLTAGVFGRYRDLKIGLNRQFVARKNKEEEINKKSRELEELVVQMQTIVENQKNTTLELEKTTEQIEHLVAIFTDPIVFGDSHGNIRKPNQAFLDVLGYREEDVTDKALSDFFVKEQGQYVLTTGERVKLDKAFFEEQKNILSVFLETGRISGWQTYYMNGRGSLVPVVQNLASIYNERKERVRYLSIMRDMTDQRKSELVLIKAKEEAEEADHAKGLFLANMSHEIRTPMNGVIGFTDMLINTGLNHEQQDHVRTIKRSAEALLSLINDILDFSKIESGQINIEQIDFDIEMLAFDVCELIRAKTLKEVELLCRIGDSVPAIVKGDPHRFRQVLVNLMGNAAKFTEKGEIELAIDVEQEQDDTVLIHTTIRDTGIGIPEDKFESIFELFQQADSSTTRKYGGTGLGLSICRKIAKLMKGDVWAESSVGKGSVFHLTTWMNRAEKQKPKRVPPVSLKGKKILVADDNQTNLDILARILSLAGLEPSGFLNGADALEAVKGSFKKKEPFDICILDINMLGMDGYEAAQKIRSIAGANKMPLIACTCSKEGSSKKCQEVGFDGFMPKPVNRTRLLKMIERLLGEQTGQELKHDKNILTQHSLREKVKHSTTILLAEDNPVNQKLAEKLLSKAGYNVSVANNGREVVDIFTASPDSFDVILMDVQMPELSGLDATQEIRQKGFDSVPIIAMTANAMKGDREKCLEAGMNDYIAKPIKREIVFEMLNKWLFENT